MIFRKNLYDNSNKRRRVGYRNTIGKVKVKTSRPRLGPSKREGQWKKWLKFSPGRKKLGNLPLTEGRHVLTGRVMVYAEGRAESVTHLSRKLLREGIERGRPGRVRWAVVREPWDKSYPSSQRRKGTKDD